jgi:hypothetical protein
MKKNIIAAIVALAITVSVLGYAEHVYQLHHISSDLKRTLIVWNNQNLSYIERESYFYEARLQVRTKRDAEVLQMFETSIQDLNKFPCSCMESVRLLNQGRIAIGLAPFTRKK